MRGWIKAGLALSLAMASVPAIGQGSFNLSGSEGEAFLEAIEKGDNNKAIPLIEEPGSRVANYKGYGGFGALHIVTRKRQLDWVGYLLKKGADPNIQDSKGDTPLHIAARIGFDQAADYFVRTGAKVNLANKRGETPLSAAVQANQPRIVEMLLKAGADPDKSDFAAGLSARDYARRDSRNPSLLKMIETIKSTKKQVAGPTLD